MDPLVAWLLAGDVAIQYQVHRNLLGEERPDLRARIATEGWGAQFLLLSYPSRWFYDILRALDYFRSIGADYDPRMQDALDVLLQKRRKDGSWTLQAKHPGQMHFDMETPDQPSRCNTLRVLRRFGDR